MSVDYKNKLLLCIVIAPLFVNGVINSYIYTNVFIYCILELIYWFILPGACLVSYLKAEENKLSDLGYKKELFGKKSVSLIIIIGLLIFIIDFTIYKNMLYWVHSKYQYKSFFEYDSMIPNTGVFKYLIIAYFSLTAGFVEETIFRGMFHKVFTKPTTYVLLSSIAFGLIHWESSFANVVSTFVLGLLFSLIYLKIRNIWPLIIAHTCTDLAWFY